jgi:iron complex transport system ATP-binding protein
LAGELAPSSGSVWLEGRPLSAYSAEELARRRAVLPQQTVLQFLFRVEEVVWMGRYPYLKDGLRTDADHQAVVSQAMRSTETEHLAGHSYPLLSGGEQARVSLARVLAQETRVLLLDEPNASLDVRHQMLVLELMRRLANDGAAVLAIVHDLSLAAACADVVWLLDRGELVAAGSPDIVMMEEILERVYRWPVRVLRRPDSAAPLVVPLLPGHLSVPVSYRIEETAAE